MYSPARPCEKLPPRPLAEGPTPSSGCHLSWQSENCLAEARATAWLAVASVRKSAQTAQSEKCLAGARATTWSAVAGACTRAHVHAHTARRTSTSAHTHTGRASANAPLPSKARSIIYPINVCQSTASSFEMDSSSSHSLSFMKYSLLRFPSGSNRIRSSCRLPHCSSCLNLPNLPHSPICSCFSSSLLEVAQAALGPPLAPPSAIPLQLMW